MTNTPPKPARSRQPRAAKAGAASRADTEADVLAGDAGSATNRRAAGGIPSTADSALSPSMSGSSDIVSDDPAERPEPRDSGRPGDRKPVAPASAPPRGRGQAARQPHQTEAPPGDDGPLDSLGKAISDPLRKADEDGPASR